jgi:hypothetical protein
MTIQLAELQSAYRAHGRAAIALRSYLLEDVRQLLSGEVPSC